MSGMKLVINDWNKNKKRYSNEIREADDFKHFEKHLKILAKK